MIDTDSFDAISIAREILRDMSGFSSSTDRMRLLRARLRCLGDAIGEPILADENNEAPGHYIRVEIPIEGSPGGVLTVAMTPRAAETLMKRS